MTKAQLEELKVKVLVKLTDKNVGEVQTENENEEFGALLAYGKAFKEVSKIFTSYGI